MGRRDECAWVENLWRHSDSSRRLVLPSTWWPSGGSESWRRNTKDIELVSRALDLRRSLLGAAADLFCCTTLSAVQVAILFTVKQSLTLYSKLAGRMCHKCADCAMRACRLPLLCRLTACPFPAFLFSLRRAFLFSLRQRAQSSSAVSTSSEGCRWFPSLCSISSVSIAADLMTSIIQHRCHLFRLLSV